MLATDGAPQLGPYERLEHAYEQERAANRDLVRKCAELDEVIGKSQQLVRDLLAEADRLRAELMAARDSARRAEKAGKDADHELRRLRRALEEATAELERLTRVKEPPPRPASSARSALRRLRNQFAKDYHPDHASDPHSRQLRQEVFKHVWSVFEELERAI